MNGTLCCPQETHSQYSGMGRLKVKGYKKIHHANNHGCKGERVAILISDKVAFRAKTTSGEGEGRHMGIKGSIHQIFPLPLVMSIDKQHKLLEPQFLHLLNGDNKQFIKYDED